ncbi:hypothetical protein LLQ46_00280 [Rouxiella badensis]|uniref:hypothetical protein n=1 Tax=Rouxiella badensis TaxID=1646377 RepID=UPI001D140775|nr:hypothetical protein [Rouxiella badensis]MCC3745285.1 hypothetical protein [Rouxiella badensis]
MQKVTFWGYLAEVSPYAWMFSLTSVILVLIGWLVTYNNSLKIATRSESKSLIDAVAKLINEINDLSIDYWVNKSTKPNSNPFKIKGYKNNKSYVTPGSKLFITTIYGKASQAVKYIDFLKERGLKIESTFLSDVIAKSTLECEKSFTFSKGYRNDRAQDVSSQSVIFMMHLYDAFQKVHPPKKSISIIGTVKRYLREVDNWFDELEGRLL